MINFIKFQVEWNPFEGQRLAVATAQHFGIVGNGRQFVLDILPDGSVACVAQFDTRDGLYDCSWYKIVRSF